jgi:Flp pilus assembly protein TadG
MRRLRSAKRRGAAAVETAIVLLVFVVLVLGMLELSIAVLRYNIVSQAARQAARQAIVRGELAPPKLSEWGPASFSRNANAADPTVEAIQPYLTGLDLNNTTIAIDWIDGSTKIQKRVRVTIVTSHQPFLTFIFGSSAWTLNGVSTMQITH